MNYLYMINISIKSGKVSYTFCSFTILKLASLHNPVYLCNLQ